MDNLYTSSNINSQTNYPKDSDINNIFQSILVQKKETFKKLNEETKNFIKPVKNREKREKIKQQKIIMSNKKISNNADNTKVSWKTFSDIDVAESPIGSQIFSFTPNLTSISPLNFDDDDDKMKK